MLRQVWGYVLMLRDSGLRVLLAGDHPSNQKGETKVGSKTTANASTSLLWRSLMLMAVVRLFGLCLCFDEASVRGASTGELSFYMVQ